MLFNEIVFTDYGQFSLEWGDELWDADVNRFFAGQQNGWVAAGVPELVHVILGRQYGGSSVIIELHDERAAEPGWEDCVEVSCRVPDGAEVRWTTFARETGGPLNLPAGSYRLRVSARWRDDWSARPEPDRIDEYLLQFWPEPPSPDSVIRAGSQNSTYWNREYGSRRGA